MGDAIETVEYYLKLLGEKDTQLAELRENVNAKYWEGIRDENMSLRAQSGSLKVELAAANERLAQYESVAASARECAERITAYACGEFTTDGFTRIILAHTSAVVEPWREMVEKLKGQLFHCAKHIHYHDTSPALANTSFKMIEQAKALIASQGVGE